MSCLGAGTKSCDANSSMIYHDASQFERETIVLRM